MGEREKEESEGHRISSHPAPRGANKTGENTTGITFNRLIKCLQEERSHAAGSL